jgi:predicted anti-sigma-YlaC factor YlaD
MAAAHPETEIVPYLRGELASEDHARVAGHLQECPDCRETAEVVGELLARLRATAPEPPAVHWGRYRAELQAKLEARRSRGALGAWWRPVPLAVSAVLAGVLVLLAFLPPSPRRGTGPDLTALEEAVLGRRLEIVQGSAFLEHLDLLENLELIRQLDAIREG